MRRAVYMLRLQGRSLGGGTEDFYFHSAGETPFGWPATSRPILQVQTHPSFSVVHGGATGGASDGNGGSYTLLNRLEDELPLNDLYPAYDFNGQEADLYVVGDEPSTALAELVVSGVTEGWTWGVPECRLSIRSTSKELEVEASDTYLGLGDAVAGNGTSSRIQCGVWDVAGSPWAVRMFAHLTDVAAGSGEHCLYEHGGLVTLFYENVGGTRQVVARFSGIETAIAADLDDWFWIYIEQTSSVGTLAIKPRWGDWATSATSASLPGSSASVQVLANTGGANNSRAIVCELAQFAGVLGDTREELSTGPLDVASATLNHGLRAYWSGENGIGFDDLLYDTGPSYDPSTVSSPLDATIVNGISAASLEGGDALAGSAMGIALGFAENMRGRAASAPLRAYRFAGRPSGARPVDVRAGGVSFDPMEGGPRDLVGLFETLPDPGRYSWCPWASTVLLGSKPGADVHADFWGRANPGSGWWYGGESGHEVGTMQDDEISIACYLDGGHLPDVDDGVPEPAETSPMFICGHHPAGKGSEGAFRVNYLPEEEVVEVVYHTDGAGGTATLRSDGLDSGFKVGFRPVVISLSLPLRSLWIDGILCDQGSGAALSAPTDPFWIARSPGPGTYRHLRGAVSSVSLGSTSTENTLFGEGFHGYFADGISGGGSLDWVGRGSYGTATHWWSGSGDTTARSTSQVPHSAWASLLSLGKERGQEIELDPGFFTADAELLRVASLPIQYPLQGWSGTFQGLLDVVRNGSNLYLHEDYSLFPPRLRARIFSYDPPPSTSIGREEIASITGVAQPEFPSATFVRFGALGERVETFLPAADEEARVRLQEAERWVERVGGGESGEMRIAAGFMTQADATYAYDHHFRLTTRRTFLLNLVLRHGFESSIELGETVGVNHPLLPQFFNNFVVMSRTLDGQGRVALTLWSPI